MGEPRLSFDLDKLPRGGPRASRLDRCLQTDRQEFLDRDDVPYRIKGSVIRSLDRMGERWRLHEKFAELALEQVAGTPSPKILELGSGHGGLSRKLLQLHPRAEVVITDVEPESVARIRDSDLGSHPRATVKIEDATAIDAPDGTYDLVVFAQSFHHLPPRLASKVIGEGTRVAKKFLIIDLLRPPSLVLLAGLPMFLPIAAITQGLPTAHDGFISMLRAYSPAAFRALAKAADPDIKLWTRTDGLQQVVVASKLV
ncbi:MAG: class I SAM-dependent methyltransferase [Segniliparus sp.]|uniref:class I SAM-dependent methyltransferase n=1 Tax=Segniliparus sp. TaxID=2804064 RepID=UPI003F3E8C3C